MVLACCGRPAQAVHCMATLHTLALYCCAPSLNGGRLTAEHGALLRGLPQLRSLTLVFNDTAVSLVQWLAGLQHLTHLGVCWQRGNQQNMQPFPLSWVHRGCGPQLRSLQLSGCCVHPAAATFRALQQVGLWTYFEGSHGTLCEGVPASAVFQDLQASTLGPNWPLTTLCPPGGPAAVGGTATVAPRLTGPAGGHPARAARSHITGAARPDEHHGGDARCAALRPPAPPGAWSSAARAGVRPATRRAAAPDLAAVRLHSGDTAASLLVQPASSAAPGVRWVSGAGRSCAAGAASRLRYWAMAKCAHALACAHAITSMQCAHPGLHCSPAHR